MSKFYLWFAVIVGIVAGLLFMSSDDNKIFGYVLGMIALSGLCYAAIFGIIKSLTQR